MIAHQRSVEIKEGVCNLQQLLGAKSHFPTLRSNAVQINANAATVRRHFATMRQFDMQTHAIM